MSEPQTRAYTDLASLKTYAGFQQTGLVLLQRKGRLQKQQASFQAQLAASAGDRVHATPRNTRQQLGGSATDPDVLCVCVQAARRLKGEALQTQLSLCLAQREAQHWKWRAGLLQLQTASREEVLELSRVLQESTAEECAISRVRLAAAVSRKTTLKAGHMPFASCVARLHCLDPSKPAGGACQAGHCLQAAG